MTGKDSWICIFPQISPEDTENPLRIHGLACIEGIDWFLRTMGLLLEMSGVAGKESYHVAENCEGTLLLDGFDGSQQTSRGHRH